MEEKLKLLHMLSFNIDPSARRMDMNETDFLQLVFGMKEEGLIWFDTIDGTLTNGNPVPFKGHPKKIHITDDGKVFYEKYKK